MQQLINLVKDERGIQHAEEALLLGLIAVALTAAVIALKDGVDNVFTQATTCLNSAPTGTC